MPSKSDSTVLIDSLELQFEMLHKRLRALVMDTPIEVLYLNPRDKQTSIVSDSIGENILRSAGVVEQTFGGITANLWDDPHDWSMPETLSTHQLLLEYLDEVEQTRQGAFAGFSSDEELSKNIIMPNDELRSLVSVLLETLVRASEFHGRAVAGFNFLSSARAREVII